MPEGSTEFDFKTVHFLNQSQSVRTTTTTTTMSIINTKIELNKNLSLITSANGENSLRRAGQDGPNSLPGQARTSLDNAPLKKYLREALLAPNLDNIAPYLWLVGMTNDLNRDIR